MREIKFKVYIKTENRIVDVIIIDFDEKVIGAMSVNSAGDPYLRKYDFDQVELMQFTGLYDKNEKNIYEGYILWDEELLRPLEVRWNKFCGMVVSGEEYLGDVNFSRSKVIGNIFENPELLEEEEWTIIKQ